MKKHVIKSSSGLFNQNLFFHLQIMLLVYYCSLILDAVKLKDPVGIQPKNIIWCPVTWKLQEKITDKKIEKN